MSYNTLTHTLNSPDSTLIVLRLMVEPYPKGPKGIQRRPHGILFQGDSGSGLSTDTQRASRSKTEASVNN